MDITADGRDRYRTLQHMNITADGRDHYRTLQHMDFTADGCNRYRTLQYMDFTANGRDRYRTNSTAHGYHRRYPVNCPNGHDPERHHPEGHHPNGHEPEWTQARMDSQRALTYLLKCSIRMLGKNFLQRRF